MIKIQVKRRYVSWKEKDNVLELTEAVLSAIWP